MKLEHRPTPLTDSLLRDEDDLLKGSFTFSAFEMLEHARKMERERAYLMEKEKSNRATMDTLKEQLKADEKAAYDLRCHLDEVAEYFGISKALWPDEKVKRIKAMKDDVEAMMVKICALISPHVPRELCETAEGVEWLVDRHKAATAAMLKLAEIRTDKLAQAGFSAEPTAICEARHILRQNADVLARGWERHVDTPETL